MIGYFFRTLSDENLLKFFTLKLKIKLSHHIRHIGLV